MTDIGRELKAGMPPFWEEGAGSPSSTMWPTAVPSSNLMHPAIWPQYMCRRVGANGLLFWEELVPHLAYCRLGRGLPTF